MKNEECRKQGSRTTDYGPRTTDQMLKGGKALKSRRQKAEKDQRPRTRDHRKLKALRSRCCERNAPRKGASKLRD